MGRLAITIAVIASYAATVWALSWSMSYDGRYDGDCVILSFLAGVLLTFGEWFFIALAWMFAGDFIDGKLFMDSRKDEAPAESVLPEQSRGGVE